MIKNPKNTTFTFILSNQQTMKNLEHLSINNHERFINSINIGKQIQKLAKDNDWQGVQLLAHNNQYDIPLLKLEIEDAFISALNLRNQQVVQYFLENGFKINNVAEDAPLSLAYSLQYLKQQESPLELLSIVLQYGANPRYASERDSDTAMHLAAANGNIPFMIKLLQYGADINSVNDDRKTPLGLAIENKQHDAIAFLKERKANAKWNE